MVQVGPSAAHMICAQQEKFFSLSCDSVSLSQKIFENCSPSSLSEASTLLWTDSGSGVLCNELGSLSADSHRSCFPLCSERAELSLEKQLADVFLISATTSFTCGVQKQLYLSNMESEMQKNT